MDQVLRVRTRSQLRLRQPRPLAVYKPSFTLNNNDCEEEALLLQPRCSLPPPVPARRRREVTPSSGTGPSPSEQRAQRQRVPTDCCCGAWARSSRIPRPQPDKHLGKAMNTRGIFSRTLSGEEPVADPSPQLPVEGRLGAVCRGSPSWTSRGSGGGVVRRCFSADHSEEEDDDQDGVGRMLEAHPPPPRRKELPPLPPSPLRRRILVRPKPDIPTYFRLCTTNSAQDGGVGDDGDTSALLAEAPVAVAPIGTAGTLTCGSSASARSPMDRFNKFRFGGRVSGGSSSPSSSPGSEGTVTTGAKKVPRTSDKTERLRELTEKLKGGSVSPDRPATDQQARPPTIPGGPSGPGPSPSPSPVPSGPPADRTAASAPQAPASAPADTSSIKDDDLFECVNLRLAKPESRAIIGSYIQRTIPFRSASFSQVDFSSADGKYFRNSFQKPQFGGVNSSKTPHLTSDKEVTGQSLSFPLNKSSPDPMPDISPTLSPASSTTIGVSGDPEGSTPSVDSAVGSDEGFDPPRMNSRPREPPGSRSMTHPLPSRVSKDNTIPYSSVDGNGLKSLQCLPAVTVQVQEVLEVSNTQQADSVALISETESLCSVVGTRMHLDSYSTSSLEQSDQESTAPAGENVEEGERAMDIKPLENPVSYEVFVRQFPNYKEYEKWMNESVLVNNSSNGDPVEWTKNNPEESPAGAQPLDVNTMETKVDVVSGAVTEEVSDNKQDDVKLGEEEVEHDDRCINYFDPSTCPKCLEQMETGPSILQKLKASFHMEDLELEPHEKELYSRHTEILLRKWPKEISKPKHVFERSKSEPKETSKDGTAFQRTKSSDEPTQSPPRISLFSSDEKDSPEGSVKDRTEDETKESSEAPTQRRLEPRRWLERPKLICQSSDERDDDSTCQPRPRFPLVARSDSLSEGESDQGERRPSTPSRASPSLFSPLDLSDSESRTNASGVSSPRSPHTPRRYSKRPLRGPYGQMLEAEMKKPEANRKLSQYTDDLKFLDEYPPTGQTSSARGKGSSQSLLVAGPSNGTHLTTTELTRSVSSGESRLVVTPRNRGAGAHSMDDSQLRGSYAPPHQAPTPASGKASPKRKESAELPFPAVETSPPQQPLPVCHQRTTSSPSQLEGIALRGEVEGFRRTSSKISDETVPPSSGKAKWKDTRTHVVVELFETERSYVESLDFLVKEYMQPLKKPENAGMVDSDLVEQIFYQVPAILSHHKEFLEDLQKRLESWDFQQKVGDVFLNAFTKVSVIDTYTAFINNWKTAKEAIKTTCQAKPAFARYLEAMAREHKGKLALDSLLIMPVQRIPRYELLIQTLLKHTDPSHADHALLLEAQREVHELAVKINCTERETLEAEQQLQVLRDLEALVEGCDLVSQGRTFLRHDLVTLASGQGTRKERVLFLFSDLVVIARIKRNLRKPSGAGSSTSVASGLEGNRYRCSMKAVLDDLEIVKAKDENLRRVLREMEQLAEDVSALTQVTELAAGLHLHQQRQQLEELAREMLNNACRQLAERQNSDTQLSCLELTLNTSSGVENITVIFTKPDKRASWEEAFNEAKTRLALSADRRPSPKFKTSVPIRKTRAGLQFTCAAPTLAGPGAAPGTGTKDVWVCNSDGYVGQVCVLSLQPEPNVTSCNGVCNARILCLAAIPAGITGSNSSASQAQGQLASSKAGISISVEDTDKAGRNLQLDSSSSSSDEDDDNDSGSTTEERGRSNTLEAQGSTSGVAGPSLAGVGAGPGVPSSGDPPQQQQQPQSQVPPQQPQLQPAGALSGSGPGAGPGPGPGAGEDGLSQPTMWLGTEDGCIHVYSCNDNIRIKRNKVKIQHGAAVHCIIYLDNRVFVSLANGDITVYTRDQVGGWNTTESMTVTVGSAACPVTRMVPVGGRLWCSCQHTIKVLNTTTLQVEQTVVAADSNRAVTCFVVSGLAVWLSVQNSAVLKLYHAITFEHLGDVNVAPAVTKMLASCDDIIRQHKAACLRVTSLLACKDLLWIGTSAGVVLTMPLPHIGPGTTKLASAPTVSGVPHGHTGHVRFLTVVETSYSSASRSVPETQRPSAHHNRHSWKIKSDQQGVGSSNELLVISGGDGYEDFRTSSVSEVAGKEDSTNHLLLWEV